jgi:hypothetical protein
MWFITTKVTFPVAYIALVDVGYFFLLTPTGFW